MNIKQVKDFVKDYKQNLQRIKDIKLPLAIFLDKDETKLIGDKNSTIYKTVVEILRWFKDHTGVELNIICTASNGDLYKAKL